MSLARLSSAVRGVGLPKANLVSIAQDTLTTLETGSYSHQKTGNTVNIGPQLRQAVANSILYTPDDRNRVLVFARDTMKEKGLKTKIEVWKCTTLEATSRLSGKTPKVCALNFASAKNAGGGFATGARGQEESLARSSGLFLCLAGKPAYYDANKLERTSAYTHHMIHSPAVPIFKDDEGAHLHQPYFVNFITAPAVNWGTAVKKVGESKLTTTMQERAEMVLAVAARHREETLVLGAWGCGVFKTPVQTVADIFKNLLLTRDSPFENFFQHVVFAVPQPETFEVFKETFVGGEKNKQQQQQQQLTASSTATMATTTASE